MRKESMTDLQEGLSSTKEEKWEQIKLSWEGEVQNDNMHMLSSVVSLNYIFAT